MKTTGMTPFAVALVALTTMSPLCVTAFTVPLVSTKPAFLPLAASTSDQQQQAPTNDDIVARAKACADTGSCSVDEIEAIMKGKCAVL